MGSFKKKRKIGQVRCETKEGEKSHQKTLNYTRKRKGRLKLIKPSKHEGRSKRGINDFERNTWGKLKV